MNKEDKKTKNRGKMAFKFAAIIFLMCILIYLGVIFTGFMLYDDDCKESYDMLAYSVAETAKGYLTLDEFEEYANAAYAFNQGELDEAALKEITERPEYKTMLELLYKLRDSNKANDIFLVTVNMDVMKQFTQEGYENYTWMPLYYIADSYIKPEENYKLGDKGSILPIFQEHVRESYESGKVYENYYISNGPFGYVMTAMLPILKDGRSIGFIGVEIPMETLQRDISTFVSRISIVTAFIVFFSLIACIALLYKNVVSPVQLISTEAKNFVDNNTQISDKLKTVKTKDEIQTLSENIYQMEVDINDYIDNLQKVTAEKERIGAELNVATQIQADMLPRMFPAFPGKDEFNLYASMNPAKEVGGDFYDFFLIDDNTLGMVMADVSGKGVPAALFMVIAKTLIKNRALLGGSPSEVLAYANDQLCEGNEAELFVTVWFAILDITTGKGIAANAGHEHPAIKRKDGKFELALYRHSPAVATMEGIRFKEHEFELFPGDSLFVYTDGVPEATDANNELYGTDRMLEALNSNPNATVKELLTSVKSSIDEFVGTAPQFDDITMLALNFFGKKEA